jgi:hypothetical protein
MAFPFDPAQREPKGDHNRRLSLGIDPDVLLPRPGSQASSSGHTRRPGRITRLISRLLDASAKRWRGSKFHRPPHSR